MQNHPNASVLETLYRSFVPGDAAGVLAVCDPNVTFQLAGKGPLAGKFTAANLNEFFARRKEIAGGTYALEVHDILASDRHGVVLASEYAMQDGKKITSRVAHVWRMENGKPVAWYGYPRDLYQFDEFFR